MKKTYTYFVIILLQFYSTSNILAIKSIHSSCTDLTCEKLFTNSPTPQSTPSKRNKQKPTKLPLPIIKEKKELSDQELSALEERIFTPPNTEENVNVLNVVDRIFPKSTSNNLLDNSFVSSTTSSTACSALQSWQYEPVNLTTTNETFTSHTTKDTYTDDDHDLIEHGNCTCCDNPILQFLLSILLSQK